MSERVHVEEREEGKGGRGRGRGKGRERGRGKGKEKGKGEGEGEGEGGGGRGRGGGRGKGKRKEEKGEKLVIRSQSRKSSLFHLCLLLTLYPGPLGGGIAHSLSIMLIYPGNSNTNAYTHMNAPPFIQ